MSAEYPNEQPHTNAPGTSAGYEPVTGAPYSGGTVPPNYPGVPYPVDPSAPIPGAPNPALAAVLGFIPGVGAMYNGQFAKGIAHIVIFAVFSTLSEHGNGIFGLLVAGWIFYMVFEAYQTARARRNGWPLPDPFGLNNIGERFGFKSNPDFSSFWAAPPAGGVPPVSETAHVDPVTGAVHYTRTETVGTQSTYHVDPVGTVSAPGSVPYASAGYVPPVPPPPGYPPYAPPAPPYGPGAYGPVYGMPPAAYEVPSAVPSASNGLPTGALWLIGLGLLALLGSLRPFRFLEGEATGGIFLIGISILLFVRSGFRSKFFPAGSRAARWNVVRTMRGAGIVFMVGLLTLLQGLHVIDWSASWPLLLIFFGAVLLAERFAVNNMNGSATVTGAYASQPTSPGTYSAPSVETSSPQPVVPKVTRPIADTENTSDQGGR